MEDLNRVWTARPADHKYETIAELRHDADRRRDFSVEDTVTMGNLRVIQNDDYDLELQGRELRRPLQFNAWSFSQLASKIGAPASYLKQLPVPLLADNINHGLQSNSREKVKIYSELSKNPRLRAITGKRYSRIYDAELLDWLDDQGLERNGWQVHALHSGDRNTHLTLLHREMAIRTENEYLRRGFRIFNSEVGAATLGCELFWYRESCTNGMIFGKQSFADFKVRHIGISAPVRAFSKLRVAIQAFTEVNHDNEARLVTNALHHQIADNGDEAAQWLQGRGFTKQLARSAVQMAELEEGGSSTLWQLVQGLTGYARTMRYQDERLQLERQAGQLLRLVA